ncbi:tyrosine-protein phosphatase [Paratractidigestivibacter sp.]|uniref:tyrosine-protein phosphatase n=1 Tax=Paratractidigestivibacter sp. TaxID=2847316 RepID=UPI002ABD9030|nr:CpsB/CapC family capsule biosynthesis tyrosine phosphatase [Paratractidigestivibacter sp.]
MRDLHCHILPGVDDGAADLEMSLRMLEAARAVGVTSMVCTPHARSPYFDYEKMVAAFGVFRDAAAEHAPEVHVSMGFEVAYRKLVQLGVEDWAPYLRFAETPEFLLELDTHCDAADFREYERTIYTLQGMGYTVIIAHPERYRAIQKDIQIARDLVRMGCKLQASADFIAGGRFGREKRPARKMFAEGLYTYIASDAHSPEHYGYLARACRDYAVHSRHFK